MTKKFISVLALLLVFCTAFTVPVLAESSYTTMPNVDKDVRQLNPQEISDLRNEMPNNFIAQDAEGNAVSYFQYRDGEFVITESEWVSTTPFATAQTRGTVGYEKAFHWSHYKGATLIANGNFMISTWGSFATGSYVISSASYYGAYVSSPYHYKNSISVSKGTDTQAYYRFTIYDGSKNYAFVTNRAGYVTVP